MYVLFVLFSPLEVVFRSCGCLVVGFLGFLPGLGLSSDLWWLYPTRLSLLSASWPPNRLSLSCALLLMYSLRSWRVIIILSESPYPGRSWFCSRFPGATFWVALAPVMLVSLCGLELDTNSANLSVLAESLAGVGLNHG